MDVAYRSEPNLSAAEFRDILVASTLSERRPAGDLARLDLMLRNADIVITARDQGRLVGVARSICDFAYCCYLSDLAIAVEQQRRGVGRKLIEMTRIAAGPQASLYLIAAPAAAAYYPHIGMTPVASGWSIPRSA